MLPDALAHERGIDAGIDDQMRDMNVLGTELARHALRDRAQAGLGAGERRIADAAANARGGAGEEDAAFAARQHQPGGFAAGQESGIAAQFPNLAKHAFGRVQQRKIDVAADIEDADFERGMRVGGAQEAGDVVFLAGVKPARHDLAAGGFDVGDQRRQLVGIAPAGEDRKPFGRKFFGDGGADEIAGTDHRRRSISLRQMPAPARPADSRMALDGRAVQYYARSSGPRNGQVPASLRCNLPTVALARHHIASESCSTDGYAVVAHETGASYKIVVERRQQIVTETAERIFADFADPQTINQAKSGAWKEPLWQRAQRCRAAARLGSGDD